MLSNLPPDEISDFPNHPFKVRMDEEMQQMAESVKEHGVLVPALVREKPGGGYEMVAGHRRKRAAELAELSEIPCIVRNLTDDEAIIVMVDSNLQREKILPSEKAFAYKMRAGRNEKARTAYRFNFCASGTEVDIKSKNCGKVVGESQDQVRRYIRLTYLLPEMLDMVDDWKKMLPSVRLWSYPIWRKRNSIFCWTPCSARIAPHPTPKLSKCGSFPQEGKLNPDVILSIMQEEKPNQKEQIKIPKERISRYFAPGTPAQKIEDTIIKALELYRKRQRSMER